MRRPYRFHLRIHLAVIGVLALLTAGVAQAQTTQYFAEECNDDAVRAEFAEEVANGATEVDLEAKYGGCREYVDPTNECTANPGALSEGLRAEGAALITSFPYPYNTHYERLGRTACGYHPQAEMVSCAIELRRRSWYGSYPSGSTEWVRFCLDCTGNGSWDYWTLGSVHVTNDISGGTLPFLFEAHATTWDAPPACVSNNGGSGKMRAILSWNAKPPLNSPTIAPCSWQPYWGNVVDVTIRRDP